MKLQTLLIVGFALGLAGCAEKEQVALPQGDDAETAAEAPAGEKAEMGTAAFIAHMHHHASQLYRLKAALDVGSLAAAQRPAYWLSGHDETVEVPDDWQVYVKGMRDGARAVADAPDLAAASAAAQRIEQSCGDCHTAAGVDPQMGQVD